MRYSTLFAGLLSLAVVNGRSTVHVEPVENLRRIPEGWTEAGAPEQTRRLHFRVAVRQVSFNVSKNFNCGSLQPVAGP